MQGPAFLPAFGAVPYPQCGEDSAAHQCCRVCFTLGLPNYRSQSVSRRIGAGTGIFTRAFLAHPEWADAIKELKAVEPSEGMRDVFSKTVSDEKGRVSIIEGTFQESHIEDGWADLVVVAQVLCLSSTARDTVSDMRRPSTGPQTLLVLRKSSGAS